MTRFVQSLKSLLDDAVKDDILDGLTKARLVEMAEDREREGGVLSVARVLAWVGGGILAFGVILVISANWQAISDPVKLIGFFALFAGVHAGAFYLHAKGRLRIFSEGLHLLSAFLFLGGIGLISQIFQIDGNPSLAILIWLIGIAPLAWCYRSAPVALLSIFALLLWLHMEQVSHIGPALSFTSIIALEIGVGVALIGLAAPLRDREPALATVFRGSGTFLLFGSVYLLGFYRHWSVFAHREVAVWTGGWAGVALLMGALGLIIGYRWMLPMHAYLKGRLAMLLGGLLVLTTLMVMVDLSWLPKGPELKFFDFGWYRNFHAMDWLLSFFAWVLWFGLAAWCVLYASRTGRRAYLNAGVLAVALGVITRFIDLVGGLMQTGLAFIVGGLVLLTTCIVVETWRRRIVQQLTSADRLLEGGKA